MIIQGILIVAFIGIILYAVIQRKRSRFVADLIIGVSLLGVGFVWHPETTGVIANALGVGRGADLILYSFVMIMLLAILNLHLRLRSLQEEESVLVRAIALHSVIEPATSSGNGSRADAN